MSFVLLTLPSLSTSCNADPKRYPGASAVTEYRPGQTSAHHFFASVASLVDASVNEYQRRGFRNLMVSFGCTGGQHRSVFMAERMAKHLRARDGVDVVLWHRELERMGK
jgi:RNase adaptor protein for sRNA GlmZ degradation